MVDTKIDGYGWEHADRAVYVAVTGGHDSMVKPVMVGANVDVGVTPVTASIGNITGQSFAATATATVNGGTTPVTANIGNASTGPFAAEATINVGTPVTAVIDGGATPVSAALTATVTSPVKLEVGLGDIGLRNTTIRFKLLGWFNLLTIEVAS